MTFLTKSLYMLGLQCPKLLWIKCHEKYRIPKPDAATQHLFDQGKLIGDLAKQLFPKGIEINANYWEFEDSDKKSREALKLRKPLFEAGFISGEIYSRADILLPVGKDQWDVIEVKSSTSVKDENIQDISFQKYCYEKAGLKIRKCFLMHINNEYLRKGKINVKKLFVKEDITKEVSKEIIGIQERIDTMLKIISSSKCPEIKIGPQCNNPYECDLKDYCWGILPLTSVFNLRGLSKTAFELYDSGIKIIENIPENFKLNEKQIIQHNCAKSGKPCIHKEKIREFLKTLKHPLYFLDFETYATAVPLYDGLKPYQNIAFQFSLHIIEKPGIKPKHYSFIAEGSGDPRKKFLVELKKVLGTKGSIIIYNKSFELGVLNKLAESFNGNNAWLKSVTERTIDLLDPFKNFYYYNNAQQGSASLKEVLPALTGKTYQGMEIAEGGTASLQYLYITHGSIDGKKASADEIKKIRKDLEEYCGLDTMAMVWIVDKLGELTK